MGRFEKNNEHIKFEETTCKCICTIQERESILKEIEERINYFKNKMNKILDHRENCRHWNKSGLYKHCIDCEFEKVSNLYEPMIAELVDLRDSLKNKIGNEPDGGFAEILAEGVTEEQRQETLKNLKEYRATQIKKGGKE